jgi:hypothetical protein
MNARVRKVIALEAQAETEERREGREDGEKKEITDLKNGATEPTESTDP